MMQINVTGGSIGQEEMEAYIARANSKYAIGTVQALDIHVDGDYVDLRYHLAPRPFSRIRRITGYLVGDMSHWNNAKAAEERDRVKHICASRPVRPEGRQSGTAPGAEDPSGAVRFSLDEYGEDLGNSVLPKRPAPGIMGVSWMCGARMRGPVFVLDALDY